MSSTLTGPGATVRQDLLARLAELGGLSALLSATIAARAGMNSTDLEALDLLRRHGPMTAGRLANFTGLTTGAVTGIIDRLDRRGFAHREADPGDRRRVIVVVDGERAEAELGPFYAGLGQTMNDVLADYTDAEVMFLFDAANRLNEALRTALNGLRVE